MILGISTKPNNPKAIKAARSQIDEVVARADDYRDWMFNHQLEFSGGIPGDSIIFDMDIEPGEDGDVDTFEFWFTRSPDQAFLAHTKAFFEMIKDTSDNGDYWRISMTKEQFSNSEMLSELLNWIFEDWKKIGLVFESEDDLDDFESNFELLLPHRFTGDFEDLEVHAKSGGKKAAAAAVTGFTIAYKEEVTYSADDEDSGFEFPEF
jgi:hypothetical protein